MQLSWARRSLIVVGAIGGALVLASCDKASDSTATSHAAKATPSPAFAERSKSLDEKGATKPTPRLERSPVSDSNQPAPGLALRANAEPSSGGAPLQVTFEGEVNEGVAGVRYRWDFGDGTTANGLNATHTYQSAGEYVATLRGTGPGVDDVDDVSITVEEEGFEVEIEADPDVGRAPLHVQFAATVDEDIPGPITVQWDFGDGARDSTNTATHTYRQPGEYTVLVTATNAQGQIARRDATITVDDNAEN